MSEITKTSVDGTEYKALKSPDKVSLTTNNYSKHKTSDGFIFHHLYVPCQEIKNKYLPLDSNPREPSYNGQIKQIQNTLEDCPELFHKRNNGITIVCDNVEYNDNTRQCKIKFGERQGICNGGAYLLFDSYNKF